MIVAEQLTALPSSRAAVHDVTFAVRRGEVFGLHGKSRDGVSLVLQLLAGIEVPAHGRVTVDGLDPILDRDQLAGRLLLVGPDGGTDGHAGATHLSSLVEVLLLDGPQTAPDTMVEQGRTVVIACPDAKLLGRCCHRGISLRGGHVIHRWSADGPPTAISRRNQR